MLCHEILMLNCDSFVFQNNKKKINELDNTNLAVS